MHATSHEERGITIMRRLGVDPGYYTHVWSIIRRLPEREWSDTVVSISTHQAKWFLR